MTTRALIFDLDGTLVDTAPDLLDALNAVLAQEGRRPVDRAALNHLVGHGIEATVTKAFLCTGGAPDNHRLPHLIAAFIAHYREHIADKSRPYPGVAETLAGLRDRGARLGVLTNKVQELTLLLLNALNLTQFFDSVHGAAGKPDPRALYSLIDKLGGRASAAAMIGDSATDVATARAAHIPVILRAGGYTPQPAQYLGADAVFESYPRLPSLLDRLLGQARGP